jgi:hypothetical protein
MASSSFVDDIRHVDGVAMLDGEPILKGGRKRLEKDVAKKAKSCTNGNRQRYIKRSKNRLSIDSITKALNCKCCNQLCMKKFTADQIRDLRLGYDKKKSNAKGDFLMSQCRTFRANKQFADLYKAAKSPSDPECPCCSHSTPPTYPTHSEESSNHEEGAHENLYSINGVPVCRNALLRIYGIGASNLQDKKKRLQEGQQFFVRRGAERDARKTKMIRLWLSQAIDHMTEIAPDDEHKKTWPVARRIDLFNIFMDDMREHAQGGADFFGMYTKVGTPSARLFYRVLKEEKFKAVRFLKEQRFTKCDVCAQIDYVLHSSRDRETLAKWREAKTQHLKFQSWEVRLFVCKLV